MAQIIGKSSPLVGKEELNIFGLPPTQIAAERYRWLTVYPKNMVPETDVSTPISFEINGVPDFLDLRKNLLKTRFQIKNRNGTNIVALKNIAPINYLANTFIKQVKIFLTNRLVYDSQDTYMHRSYIETLINASKDVKSTQLQLAGWHQDANPVDEATNAGFVQRKALAAGSVAFEVLAPLHTDIFNQTLYMLPNIHLRIELYRHSPEMVLHGITLEDDDQFSLHLKSIEFNIRVVEVNKSLSMTIERQLTKQTANYPIKRTVVRTVQLNQGTRDVRNLEIYNGQLPTTMLVTFISSDPFNGAIGNSPFQYQPYNLESIQAVVGGQRWPVEKPLELNINANGITEAYFQFINNCGFGATLRDTNGITMDDYKRHSFFIAFDLRSDEKDDNAVDLIKHGETRLFLRFRQALANNIHVIVYLNFDNILRLDSGRNPLLDYSV